MSLSCKERIAPYIIDPLNKYKVMWDVSIGLIYLMSFLLDPIVFAFKFVPLESKIINRFSEFVTYMLVVDILIVPFTGVPKED